MTPQTTDDKMVPRRNQSSDHVAIEFGPFKNVLFTDNVRVDEQVAVTYTKVLLAGCTFEALQVVDLVSHTHSHLKRTDPLLA